MICDFHLLQILEPRFNADTLANLLSIPNNKSLLRRHIATQFGTLLNETCQRQKEMTAKSADYIPLNASEKRKVSVSFTCILTLLKFKRGLTSLINSCVQKQHTVCRSNIKISSLL